jgi:hypothetical protein
MFRDIRSKLRRKCTRGVLHAATRLYPTHHLSVSDPNGNCYWLVTLLSVVDPNRSATGSAAG